jgi:hypothetical protein
MVELTIQVVWGARPHVLILTKWQDVFLVEEQQSILVFGGMYVLII